MKITQFFQEDKVTLSLEVFPPKKDTAVEQVSESVRAIAAKCDRWPEDKLDGHADRHERSAGRADKREWKQPAADAESAVRKSGYAGDGERIVKRKRS